MLKRVARKIKKNYCPYDIDYHIYGEEMQFVEIELDPLETVIAEADGFMMMDDGIEMATSFGEVQDGGG